MDTMKGLFIDHNSNNNTDGNINAEFMFPYLHSAHNVSDAFAYNQSIAGDIYMQSADNFTLNHPLDDLNSLPWPFIVGISIVLGTLICVTLVGNGIVLLMVVRVKRLRNCKNSFVFSLCLSDFFIGCTLPVSVLETVNMFCWWSDWLVCKLYLTIRYSLFYISLLSILLISLDRWWSIHRPFTYRVRQSKRLALWIILIIWNISFLAQGIPMLIWEHVVQDLSNEPPGIHKPFRCKALYDSNIPFICVSVIIEQLIPIFLLIALNASVYVKIHKRKSSEIRRSISCLEALNMGLRNSVTGSSESHHNDEDEISPLNTDINNHNSISSSGGGYVSSGRGSHHYRPNGNYSVPLAGLARHHSVTNNNIASNSSPLARHSRSVANTPSAATHKLGLPTSFSAPAVGFHKNRRVSFDSNIHPKSPHKHTPSTSLAKSSVDESGRRSSQFSAVTFRLGADSATKSDGVCDLRTPTEASRMSRTSCSSSSIFSRRASTGEELVRDLFVRQDKKAARSLGILVVVFTLCWTPTIICKVVQVFCHQCVPEWTQAVTLWILALSTSLNPFLYALGNKEFRRVFRLWVTRLSRARQRKFQENGLYQSVDLPRQTSKEGELVREMSNSVA